MATASSPTTCTRPIRQDDTGLYALTGVAGDPIGDGLALNISGGDGANNQYSKDEVDPIAPAQAVFTYQAGASAMLAEPIRPTEAAPADPQDARTASRRTRRARACARHGRNCARPEPAAPARPLRRQAISARARRACASTPGPTRWSTSPSASRPSTVQPPRRGHGTRPGLARRQLPRPVLLTPANGQAVPAGDVGVQLDQRARRDELRDPD